MQNRPICTRPELNRREKGKKGTPKPIENSRAVASDIFSLGPGGRREGAQLSARDGVIVARKHSFVAPNSERTEREGEGGWTTL